MSSNSRPDGNSQPDRVYPTMSPREVESLIAAGETIIIVDQYVMKVDSWMPYHPGGSKAIQHMVGRDATDEVNGLHSTEARRMMNRYRIGKIEGIWRNFLPPIQGGKFRAQTDSYETDEHQEQQSSLSKKTDLSPLVSDSESSSRSLSPQPIFDDDIHTAPAHRTTSMLSVKASSRFPDSDTMSATSSSCSLVATEVRANRNDKNEFHERNSENDAKTTSKVSETSFLDAKTREEINLDLDKYPSLDAKTQQHIIHKYRELNERVREAGLFDCNYTAYAWETLRYVLLLTLAICFLRMKWFAISSAFLGAFWHQLTFTVHDAGHMGITHKFHIDTVIGIVIADFLGGLSVCWWKDNHNVHHIVTNSPEHDPDIEHMPFFAVSHRFLQSLRSSYYNRIMVYDAAARLFVSVQAWTYYLILCFGRFNLYRLSWQYILMGSGPRKGSASWHRMLEAVGQVFFWTWYGYGVVYRSIDTNWNRFVFVMISHVITMPLHVQITLSHFAMSTADLGPNESFPQRMLRTTMDIECPQWLDFFHGGLQFQAVHHLYPRMPRHNLRQAQKLVQEFCDDVGIPYALYGFVDGNKQVIGRLADVSRQAVILAKCQQAIVACKA